MQDQANRAWLLIDTPDETKPATSRAKTLTAIMLTVVAVLLLKAL